MFLNNYLSNRMIMVRDRPEVLKSSSGQVQYYTTLPYELIFGYGHILYTYEWKKVLYYTLLYNIIQMYYNYVFNFMISFTSATIDISNCESCESDK